MYATSRHPRGEGISAPTRSVSRAIAICLLAAWMLFAHREADAQQFVFRHYQEREGIGNLSVTCLLQDKEGFIWACTENGLYRYDGVAFEGVGDAQGLGNSTIRAAAQDGAGTLWIGTAQDLYRGDGSHFKPIRPEGRRLKLGSGLRIAALSPDHLLVIDGAELLELTSAPGDGQWRIRTYFPESLVHSMSALRSINSVYVDRLDRIWLGCDGAICRVEQGAVKIFDANFNVPLDTWSSWALDRDGRLWARGQAHLVVLEPDAARFESRDPPHAGLTAGILQVPLVEDPQGRMLTSTDGGLSRWQNGWREYSGINGIPTTGISAILSSQDGQVWLGVPGFGVQRWLGYDHVESWTRAQGLGAAGVPFTYAGSAIRVTAGFGVAWMSGRADTAEMLLSRADAALHGAKQAGRNRVEYAASG